MHNSTIVVTGGAGFIGSNIIKKLNETTNSILVVDNLSNGKKIHNLADLNISDYMDKDEFYNTYMSESGFHKAKFAAIIHQGACSNTSNWDGKYLMSNNYEYTKKLIDLCSRYDTPLIYASSASIYGNGDNFNPCRMNEHPINAYAYSKFLADNYLRRLLFNSTIVGLRYFNVYGPRENHKENMCSPVHAFNQQLSENSKIKLFDGIGKDCKRDFIHVDDVVDVVLWFLQKLQNKEKVGNIYNVGTGVVNSFEDVANILIVKKQYGFTEYVPFPERFIDAYQSYTCANINPLRDIGYKKEFMSLEDGITKFLSYQGK